MNSFQQGWYVLYVKSKHEKKVKVFLDELLIESYVPLVKTIRKWKDRKKVVFQTLFTSYVFVYLKSSLEFYKALSVNGACTYIRFGKEYARVRDAEIAQVRLLLENDNIEDITATTEKLPRVGELKKIVYGPLNGLDCRIIKVDNHYKIIVQIDSLHQNIIATISNKNLTGSF